MSVLQPSRYATLCREGLSVLVPDVPGHRLSLKPASWNCAAVSDAVQTVSAPNSGRRPARQPGLTPPPGAYLCQCDPLTGVVIRSSKATAMRYERSRPGELVHMDVRRSAGSPTAVAGASTVATVSPVPRRPRSDTTTSIPWSMTIPDWRTPRSCPTRRARPVQIPDPGRRLLPGSGNHLARTPDDRQRLGLQILVTHGVRRSQHAPGVHQTALSLAERESRAAQPNPANRVGLPAGLHHQR